MMLLDVDGICGDVGGCALVLILLLVYVTDGLGGCGGCGSVCRCAFESHVLSLALVLSVTVFSRFCC